MSITFGIINYWKNSSGSKISTNKMTDWVFMAYSDKVAYPHTKILPSKYTILGIIQKKLFQFLILRVGILFR